MSYEKLTEHLDDIVKAGKTPCNDFILCQNHKILYRHLGGYLEAEQIRPARENSLYYLFSGSKVITVTAALQLIDQGKMSLDDQVCRYLPAYKEAYILRKGVKVPVGSSMTVRHLFMMASGLDYDWERANVTLRSTADHIPGTVEIVNGFVQLPLKFAPGRRFLYSLSHDVLGALVEVVSGERFSDYLKTHIFDVVGMPNTFFPPRGKEQIGYEHERLAKLYVYTEDPTKPLAPFFNGYIFNDNYESGGAGLITNAMDYIRFADALACGGECENGNRLLKEDTVKLLGTEQLSTHLIDPSFTCAAGPGYGYGLGVRVLTSQSNGQRSSLGEFGWDGAVGAYLLSDPVKKTSIVYLQSADNWVGPINGHQTMRDLAYDEMES